VDWVGSERAFPVAVRFKHLAAISAVETRTERGEKISTDRRAYITSRPLTAKDFAQTVRSQWVIEYSPNSVLDVTVKEDLSRLRTGNRAWNMAVVRRFALNLIRQAKDRRAIKRRGKVASWNPEHRLEILQPIRRYPDSVSRRQYPFSRA
jgi:predicted transposase YbfD/YdcC